MAKKKRDFMADIKANQEARLSRKKRFANKFKDKKVRQSSKPVKRRKFEEEEIFEVKTKPIVSVEPVSAVDIVEEPMPLDGTAEWVMEPTIIADMTPEEIKDQFKGKFQELRKMGYQYDVRGGSAIEISYEVVDAAKKIINAQ